MFSRRHCLAVSMLPLALVALSGCKKEEARTTKEAPAAASTPASDLSIEAARLVLPAVKGNPGAAYLTVVNRTTGTRSIVSITVDGSERAEMHQTIGTEMNPVDRFDIAPGTSAVFEPGKLHVMVFNLVGNLKAGGKTKVTVRFADGEKVDGTLGIVAPGGEAMGGMDHGDMH